MDNDELKANAQKDINEAWRDLFKKIMYFSPGRTRVSVARSITRPGFDVYLARHTPGVGTAYWRHDDKPILEPHGGTERNDTIQPTITLKQDEAEELMDSLWALGLRPKGHGGEHQTRAMQKHIDSLQEIVTVVLPSALRERAGREGDKT